MNTAQIPREQLAQIRRFVVDIGRHAEDKGNFARAFTLYKLYNGSKVPQLAEEYKNGLNGGSKGAKARVALAINEFKQIGILVETVILPAKKAEPPHEKELGVFDFWGIRPGGIYSTPIKLITDIASRETSAAV